MLIDRFQQAAYNRRSGHEYFRQLMDTSTSRDSCNLHKTDLFLPKHMDFVIIADQLVIGKFGNCIADSRCGRSPGSFYHTWQRRPLFPKSSSLFNGTHFHIICTELDWLELQNIKLGTPSHQLTAYVSTADGQKSCWDCDFTLPTLLIIGSEADGASEKAFQLADHRVSIPMPGNFESLNAAVAAGILLFEVVRQRKI